MDTKIQIMASLAAAYAAGCIPCFDYYYMQAKEKQISDDDIGQAVAIAQKVRKGSDIALEKSISDLIDGKEGCAMMDDASHPCRCS